MHANVTEKRNQEIAKTMLKARDAKYSVPMRYGKVLFCGAAAAGKSNFLNLLMKQDFQSLHISTEVLKPQQVTIAMKAVISSSDDEVKFTKMSIDEEILQLESYLPEKYITPTAPHQKNSLQEHSQDNPIADDSPNKHITPRSPLQKSFLLEHSQDKPTADDLPKKHTISIASVHRSSLPVDKQKNPQLPKRALHHSARRKLALATVAGTKKINNKQHGQVWNILTFMDTGGQPQFISMLPAVNSFAMITFIVHKMKTGGQDSLNKTVEVQYGNEKGEISYKPHPHKYTYLQLIETLISYASNIVLPDNTFLDKVKRTECKESENSRSIVLAGTHSGDNQLSEDDIKSIDKELQKAVEKSGINYIKPYLNKHYQYLVPVDNKKQGKTPESQVTAEDAKRYTNPSDIRRFIQKFLNHQDEVHVPVKWLILELEIRKLCQQKNCNLISYENVLKLAKRKKLGYNGEFGDDVDDDQFIKQGLRFHHSFGVLLYFEDVEGMQNLVITNHQWLFNKLSKIVEYSFTCNSDTREEAKELTNGIFKKSLLDIDCLDISQDFRHSKIDSNSVDPINAFVNLLEHLRIAAPLTDDSLKYFMPCLLDSCKLTDLKEKVPGYEANDIEPLLIQFKSTDNKNYSFPRGTFCFLVVELMLSMKWNPRAHGEAYVNLITLFHKDAALYVTLIDRIFCLEVHVKYKKDNNVHDEVRKIIDNALHTISKKLKIDCNLCYGFICLCEDCPLSKEIHISYIQEAIDKDCCCNGDSLTDITDSHKVWLRTYFKVCM